MGEWKTRPIIKWLIGLCAIFLIGTNFIMWKIVRDTRINTQNDYAIFQNDLFQHGVFVSKTIITLHQILHIGSENFDYAQLKKKLDVYTRSILGHQSINLEIYSKVIERLPPEDPLSIKVQISELRPRLIEHLDLITKLNIEISKTASTDGLNGLMLANTQNLESFLLIANESMHIHSQILSSFFQILKDNNSVTIQKLSRTLWLLLFLLVSVAIFLIVYLLEQNRYRRLLKDANESLEMKVRERTHDLRITNKQLENEVKERRQKENALSIKEAELKKAQEIAHLGNWAMDIKKDRIEWSDELYRIFQIERRDLPTLTYQAMRDLVHPEDREYHDRVTEKMKQEGKSDFEYRLIHADGRVRYISGQGETTYDMNGSPVSLFGIAQDITEKKELESRLQQAQKMESIGNLAGGIAHDFNNILASMIGFTELALDDAAHGSTTEEYLQEIYTGGKRARDIVKQILAFARQSGEEIKPIEIGTIIGEVTKLIRSTIPATIEIREDIDSNSLVLANPTQVHQLLMNICTNAAQAMVDKGGVIDLNLKDVFLDSVDVKMNPDLRPGDYVSVKISDTGTGIDPDIIGLVFEPYFTTKGPGEGSGMGLAMAHGIVESYGGEIAVESAVGKGTTFTIHLPATRKRKTLDAEVPGKLPTGTERILFVDDEAPIAKMGSRILERSGYTVTTRTSSLEALELFRDEPGAFDLVITDMTMPDMTGDVLAVKLIQCRHDIPVILFTGYSKSISEETAGEIGIKAFAYKPIVKAELLRTVRDVMDEINPPLSG